MMMINMVQLRRLAARNHLKKILLSTFVLCFMCACLYYEEGTWPRRNLKSFFYDKEIDSSDQLLDFSGIPICPAIPPSLSTNLTIVKQISIEDVEIALADSVHVGGSSSPVTCIPRWSVAILVPFRNREDQVGPFLNHMHRFLSRQQLNYTIYIVHQADKRKFNRAKLLNVGYVEAMKAGPYDCFVFHDVDLLPESNRHLYHCSAMPRHLNVAASNTDYKEMYRVKYSMYFGGVHMMTPQHFELINGFSNKYWGWGGEDDDIRVRIAMKKLHVWRYPKEIARYTMLPHKSSEVNPRRYDDLRDNIQNSTTDGLNSLKYHLVSIKRKPLFTHILVDIDFQ